MIMMILIKSKLKVDLYTSKDDILFTFCFDDNYIEFLSFYD